MTTAAVITLAVLVAAGLLVQVLGRRVVERHTISTREFPNVAPKIDSEGDVAALPRPAGDTEVKAA